MTERLYAPWREEFILSAKKDESCIFCGVDKRPQVRDLILHRGKHAFVVLNRYPYNAGHLMVVPYRHIAALDNLSPVERNEFIALIALSSRVLTDTQRPAGLNIGMNLGRAAGAGIDGHLHMHLVPRWVGDTNFLPVFSDTRIISVDLANTMRRLKAAFRKAVRSSIGRSTPRKRR